MYQQLYHTQTQSHWQSVETLKVVNSLNARVPGRNAHVTCSVASQDIVNRLARRVAAGKRWILLLDCANIHIDEGFIEWTKNKHPLLTLVYIPANFTKYLQAHTSAASPAHLNPNPHRP